jgi:hypothetical protein
MAERNPRSFSTGAVRTGTSIGCVTAFIGPGLCFSRGSGSDDVDGSVGSSARREDLRFRKAPNLCWVLRCALSGGSVAECATLSGEKSAVFWIVASAFFRSCTKVDDCKVEGSKYGKVK